MDNDLSCRFKVFSSILNGLFITSNIIFMILFILLLNNPINIIFSIFNCSFLILGLLFDMFFIIFDKNSMKIISDDCFIISFVFLIFILLFNNFFIFNKWVIFGFILFISIVTIILNSIDKELFGVCTSIVSIVFLIILSILYLNIMSRSFLIFCLSLCSLISCILFNLLYDKYKYNYFYSIIFFYLFTILNYIIIFIYL